MATDSHKTARASTGEAGLALSRRQFLTKLSVAAGGLGALLIGIPVLSFLLAPLLRTAPQFWRAVGAVDTFKIGETVRVTFQDPSPLPWAGVAANTAAWLRREGEQQFVAFAVNCTHLGCPVRWLPDAQLFMCPCHGGVFYQDGAVAAGPPPRHLTRYEVRVSGGQVEILAGPSPIAG